MELLSNEGLRQDGRTTTCLRAMKCKLGLYDRPNGSAFMQMGNTQVLASVYGPKEARSVKSTTGLGECVVTCAVSRVAACSAERLRKPRDQRTRATSNLVAGALQAAVRGSKYAGSQIDVFVQVIQADGGVTACCINAACLALLHAGIEVNDYVTACTASAVPTAAHTSTQTCALVDACQSESSGGCEVTVAMLPNKQRIVALHTCHPLHQSQFDAVLDMALFGCQQLYQGMHAEVQNFLKQHHAIMSHR
ncbi:exosome complex component RRP41 [Hyalella azteca]|uniref:Exosome complex component RRP41 n=1 Tax=Hyalella azteca TaxID=294128 RepID=A0A8B7NU26_HYAAZ|nr:exosome complex component RRP41 [Hyalella azteca]